MNHLQLQHLRDAFAAQASRLDSISTLGRQLCEALGPGPHPAVVDVFGRYYRILSNEEPNVPLFLAGLHHLALTGEAPGLAALFPSCGGAFRPQADGPALAEAAGTAVSDGRESLLDFLLSYELQPHVVERSAAVAAGAMAVAAQFGGGVSLVEFGCSGGLNLLFDRYAYRFGRVSTGESPLTLAPVPEGDVAALEGLARQGLPPVVGRYGLDPAPRNPAEGSERLLLESFLWPDAAAQVGHLRTASDLLAAHGAPAIRTGTAEEDLLPLLAEAYAAMPEGNTLLVVDTFVWPYLSALQQEQTAWAIQRQAARLTARKPMAWLQLEPVGAGSMELKLHTFNWTDQEDRTVRRIGETDPYVSRLRWLG